MAEVAEAKAPEIGLGDIAKLIQDMSGKLESIGERVGKIEQDKKLGVLANIRPMDPPEDLGAARKRAFAQARKGEDAEGTHKMKLDAHGHRLQPGTILPRFHQGDNIRILRDVAREGFPKEGDPFPQKYITDSKGNKRIPQEYVKWHKVFPEATENFPRDVVWGDLLDAIECEGVGVIKFADFLGKLGEWKYKAYIPGLTRKSGDGFYEYEIGVA